MVAILVEEHLLDWSITLVDVFPQWKDSIASPYLAVTLDDLFRHRAALPPFEPVGASEFKGTAGPRPAAGQRGQVRGGEAGGNRT